MAQAGLLQIDVEQLPHDVNNNGSLVLLLFDWFLWQMEHTSINSE